jgi:hypothetical protein
MEDKRIAGLIFISVTILGAARQRATRHLVLILEQGGHDKAQLHIVKQYDFLKIRHPRLC